MYQLTIFFKCPRFEDNTALIQVEKDTFEDAIKMLGIYYIEYDEDYFWTIVGFTIEYIQHDTDR